MTSPQTQQSTCRPESHQEGNENALSALEFINMIKTSGLKGYKMLTKLNKLELDKLISKNIDISAPKQASLVSPISVLATPSIILYSEYELKLINSNKALHNFLSSYKISSEFVGASKLKNMIKHHLNRKYLTSIDTFNVKVINDVIYNENTHIVSVFKDFLIYDDVSEFMKRYYNSSESIHRLPKIFEFYEKYSKIFPNYVVLSESKYMFKNIEKKQKLIDEQQKDGKKKNTNTNNSDEEDNRIFDSLFMNKLNKAGSTFDPSLSAQSQLHSYIMNSKIKIDSEHTFQDLIDNVLSKDSVSFAKNDKLAKEQAISSKKSAKTKESKKSPDKKVNAKAAAGKEFSKEIKIKLVKDSKLPSQPTTHREYTTQGITQEKSNIIPRCTSQKKVRTISKTAGRDPTPSIGKIINYDAKYESKRAHSSQKPSMPKKIDMNCRKITESPNKNGISHSVKCLFTTTPIKSQAMEGICKDAPATTKNQNIHAPNIDAKIQIKQHNDIKIDIEVISRGSTNPKGDSAMHTKKSQSQKPNGGAAKIPEYISPKIIAIQKRVNPPLTAKDRAETRMLFSKSATRSERAKERLDAKTPSERKEFISIKIESAKMTNKNFTPSNAFQPLVGTYKKYDFYMDNVSCYANFILFIIFLIYTVTMAQNEIEVAKFQKTSKLREDLADIFGVEVYFSLEKGRNR